MTPNEHAKAKELFLGARELEPQKRQEFLDQACGGDEALLREILSLLDHDHTGTIMAKPTVTLLPSGARVGRRHSRLAGRLELAIREVLQQIFRSRSRIALVTLATIALLIGLATWTFVGMHKSSRSIAASELRTILNADVTALELWIEEKKKDVRLLASRNEIREAIDELVQISEKESNPAESLRSSQALNQIRSASEKFDRIIGRPEHDGVLTRDGLVLATQTDDAIGARMNAEGIVALSPVFQGETIFLRPQPEGAFSLDTSIDLNHPVVFVVAPVRRDDSEDSEIIAAAAFGFPADDEFTDILSVARKGHTGETYTFDENGLLLSESRFDDELRQSGLLPDERNVRSIFRIEIRDPGNRANWRTTSPLEAAARPLTRLAAAAIAAGRKGSEPDQQGVIMDPYRNYRGEEVIGAWQWLPAYSMAVATEVQTDEQFAPLRYPMIATSIRFSLLTFCVLALLGAAGWIAILGRDVEQARQLGQYTLEEKIGEGGMGIVYRARHALLRRPTAIKLLHPESVNETSLARFEREVQLASSLTHPNTIEIFDFGRTPDGSFYCVMEYLKGRTLEEIGRNDSPLPVSRAVHLLSQIAGSLNEAHQHGLVHRDIKPSNIMVCELGGLSDFVKVLDFGLARTIEPTQDSDITATGLVAGTPSYLAPERITDPSKTDPRSDLYAFGAVAYFLLTGKRLYDHGSAAEIMDRVVTQDPQRPSAVTTNRIPSELEDLILRCLARRIDDRPPTMKEVVTEVAEIDASLAISDSQLPS